MLNIKILLFCWNYPAFLPPRGWSRDPLWFCALFDCHGDQCWMHIAAYHSRGDRFVEFLASKHRVEGRYRSPHPGAAQDAPPGHPSRDTALQFGGGQQQKFRPARVADRPRSRLGEWFTSHSTTHVKPLYLWAIIRSIKIDPLIMTSAPQSGCGCASDPRSQVDRDRHRGYNLTCLSGVACFLQFQTPTLIWRVSHDSRCAVVRSFCPKETIAAENL